MSSSANFHIAIIGGGITGLSLAIGLQARNVSYTVYERSPSFREVGAGIGFSPNAELAMQVLSPRVHAAFKKVANPNGEDYFQWVDGFETDSLVFKLYFGKDGFQGCRRADFLDELAGLVPGDKVKMGRELVETTVAKDGRVGMRFSGVEGVEYVDAVVGCDGIHSTVRPLLLGPSSPSAQATYTHKSCFRALVPMASALSAVGPDRALTRYMYNGPSAHVITYPVNANRELNILCVISDPSPWVDVSGQTRKRHVVPGTRAEAEAVYKHWTPTVRKLVGLMPERMDKWAVFDMADFPAPYYARGGPVCLAGDAAHATGPHLGAGGGMGIEDALILAALARGVQDELNKTSIDNNNNTTTTTTTTTTNTTRTTAENPVNENILPSSSLGGATNINKKNNNSTKAELVRDALAVYSDVRHRRTQDVVAMTRSACDLFQWQDPLGDGRDPKRFGREITARFNKIWHYDVEGMVRKALDEFEFRISENAFL